MAFTPSHALRLLRSSHERGRTPHALLIVGDVARGAHEVILGLIHDMNGLRVNSLEKLEHEYVRVVRPRSKSRRILIEDVRGVEPFLRRMADIGKTKVVVIMDAECMSDESSNAFLKTLEEPPPSCLLVLLTNQPERLLPTILSRCVRVDLMETAHIVLTPIQQAMLPYLARATKRVGQDMTAIEMRGHFLSLLADSKERISKAMAQAVKAEAQENYGEGSKDKDAVAAMIETEYLAVRAQALDALIIWFGQAILVASQAPRFEPLDPHVLDLAQAFSVIELGRRMNALYQLKNDLGYNVHEGLACDVHLLTAFGA